MEVSYETKPVITRIPYQLFRYSENPYGIIGPTLVICFHSDHDYIYFPASPQHWGYRPHPPKQLSGYPNSFWYPMTGKPPHNTDTSIFLTVPLVPAKSEFTRSLPHFKKYTHSDLPLWCAIPGWREAQWE